MVLKRGYFFVHQFRKLTFEKGLQEFPNWQTFSRGQGLAKSKSGAASNDRFCCSCACFDRLAAVSGWKCVQFAYKRDALKIAARIYRKRACKLSRISMQTCNFGHHTENTMHRNRINCAFKIQPKMFRCRFLHIRSPHLHTAACTLKTVICTRKFFGNNFM